MFDHEEAEDSGIVFRDLCLLMFAGFVSILVMVLSHVADATKTTEGNKTRAGVQIVAQWPDELSADVDLWVKAPGDIPVGYSNKGGAVFNLLRDDLGNILDLGKSNFEISQSRGIPTGEYIVNLHLYRNNSANATVPVTVTVGVQPTDAMPMQDILKTNVVLNREGQEITALRFQLDSEGKLVPDSVSTLFKPLRSGVK